MRDSSRNRLLALLQSHAVSATYQSGSADASIWSDPVCCAASPPANRPGPKPNRLGPLLELASLPANWCHHLADWFHSWAEKVTEEMAELLRVISLWLRLVLDTDVVVAALRSDLGASRQLLLSALKGRIELLVSVPLMVEYEAVLSRREHLTLIGLTSGQVGEILDALAAIAIPVRLSFLWRPRLKDPGDEMVLETAVNGAADRLVTFNVRHLAAAALDFGIRVLKPNDAWKEVQRRNEKK
jgi:putative PIN family toxin of toxin-antitoxin system